MMRFHKVLCVLAVLTALTGCAGMTTGGGPEDQSVLAAGDIGALGCAAFAVQGKPDQVAKARDAVAAAQAVLASETPTVTAFNLAIASFTDPRWQPVARAALDRIRMRTGGGDPIPRDSLAYQVASAFVGSCSIALGTQAVVAPRTGVRLASNAEQRGACVFAMTDGAGRSSCKEWRTP